MSNLFKTSLIRPDELRCHRQSLIPLNPRRDILNVSPGIRECGPYSARGRIFSEFNEALPMDFFLAAEPKALAGFDVEELYNLTGGDPLVIRRLLEGLVEGINEDLATLAHVRACGANNGVMELAHRVKGAARLIKAHSLTEHCEQLQLAYRRSLTLSNLSLPLGRMENSMVLLKSNLLRLSKLRE